MTPPPNLPAGKMRTYFKVNRKGKVTGTFRLLTSQVPKLNAEFLHGEKLMRHAPKQHEHANS